MRYQKGEDPDQAGRLKYASFELLGQEFAAMGSARNENFAFNEAISFMVPRETQQEIDSLWERLSANPDSGQCGCNKDAFGPVGRLRQAS